MPNKNLYNNSSILIATFSPWKNNIRAATNGMIEPMLSYMLPNFKETWLIDQPYPGSDKIFPTIEEYIGKKLKRIEKTTFFILPLLPFLYFTNKPGTQIAHKIRDFLSVIETGLKRKKKFDIFVGLESINALAGIVLKKMGRVSTVIYYVSDYSPKRFNNTFINNFYLWLDRMAAMHCDYIWDVSPAMQPARISVGLNPQKSAPIILVPNALFENQLIYVPFEKREKKSVVFVGTLGLENGPDIAIEAFREVVKSIKDATLHIIGGGGQGFEAEYLQKLIKKYSLEKNVIFHGPIWDLPKLSSMISHYQIGLAPYKRFEGSIRLYGDATKLRIYAASGLAIIATDVPPLGKELSERKAAVIVKSNKDALAKAIIQLLEAPQKIKKMTEYSKKYAKNNIWDNTYRNALLGIEKTN
ncbi:MAG TPA: glycosyltransferase family 4 protein [Candidatus Eisenbacteria bacterium]|nr:glycosyltransferase family 4 protein [Candidatus Eisenbacteria bacterium]